MYDSRIIKAKEILKKEGIIYLSLPDLYRQRKNYIDKDANIILAIDEIINSGGKI